MIPRTIPLVQTQSWQESLSNLVTSPAELFDILQLNPADLPRAEAAAETFPLRATREFVSRIAPNTLDDPLLRQILPLGIELDASPKGFSEDPLEEEQANLAPGLIHKYHGRVLLVAASQCAINCRYCFRRHFDYKENQPSREEWQRTFAYIRENDAIEEVILSGGDPLVISDKQFQWLVSEVENIPHVQRLRIHSRLPVVLPQRITEPLLNTLTNTRLQTVLVVHCNHAQEIDDDVIAALLKCQQKNVIVLNQAVLLKGINDSLEAQITLHKTLFKSSVLPYYLHLLDKVTSTSHFEVSIDDARSLYQALLANLPGYLVPKLTKEVPNASSKQPII